MNMERYIGQGESRGSGAWVMYDTLCVKKTSRECVFII